MKYYQYQPETLKHFNKLPANTVSEQAHSRGIANHEPLIIILDSLIRYAKAHEARFDNQLVHDHVLGPAWLASLTGIRRLMDGDGAVAHEKGFTTDSKDNGACEAMFWDAMALAGFKEEDI